MNLLTKNRRRDERHDANGPVSLSTGLGQACRGALVDVSAHGFRACHSLSSLCSGDIVEFAYEGRSGHATVAWTRITAQGVESGFFILGETSPVPQRPAGSV